MEISVMITELKNESVSIARILRVKQNESTELHEKIRKLDAEIQTMTDRYDALKMAIDSLELAKTAESKPAPVVTVPEPAENPASDPGPAPRKVRGATKRVVRKDSKDRVLGEFRSVAQAAKSFGWTDTSMRKYIENTSKDKQIRLRGYYLAYKTE